MLYTIYLNTFNELTIKKMKFDEITKDREGYAPTDLKFGVSFFVKNIDCLKPDEMGLNRVATHIYKGKIYGNIYITVEDLNQSSDNEEEEENAKASAEEKDDILINSYNAFGENEDYTIEEEINNLEEQKKNLSNTIEYYKYLQGVIKNL